ncbi:MAG: sirohydrochlorin cobaltochelatase [Deltaproteobacteria bacterium]|nr:MAG: sirohydrochlorin cobaltochelatase [Deltaproteobacteria bacterium]
MMHIPIIITAFGTTTTARQTYALFDQQVRAAFPSHEIFWAYSSRLVRDFAHQRHSMILKAPKEVLVDLQQQGHEWGVVQSLHLIGGHEFYRLVEEVRQCQIRTSMGLPLLSSPADYVAFMEAVADTFAPIQDDEALILVGHGTDHPSWSTYLAVQYLLQKRFGANIHVGVIEGTPARAEILETVARSGIKRVRLVPLMLVAGVHIQEDLAGPEDSWKTAFEEEGFPVTVDSTGLLYCSGIIEIFLKHIDAALAVIPDQ